MSSLASSRRIILIRRPRSACRVLFTPSGRRAYHHVSMMSSLMSSFSTGNYSNRLCWLQTSSSDVGVPAPHSTFRIRRRQQSYILSSATTGTSSRRYTTTTTTLRRPDNDDNGDSSILDDDVSEKEQQLQSLLEGSSTSYSGKRVADTEDFLVVLRALAESNLPDAAFRAERWIRRLEQQSLHGVLPNAECYQRVIECWGSKTMMSDDPVRAIVRAERWLWKHKDSRFSQLSPDTNCFNAFLELCTRGSGSSSGSGSRFLREHAEKAHNVLQYMMEQAKHSTYAAPDTDSFNFVMRGWTRCRRDMDVVDRAMNILSMMETFGSTVGMVGVRPNAKTYHMIMDAVAVRARLKVQRCVKQPHRCRHDDGDANGMAEIEILHDMIAFFDRNYQAGDASFAPNTFAYNAILSCWANIAPLHAEQAPAEAEKLLRQMTLSREENEGPGPDAFSYLLVMRAWINSGLENRGPRITWLLSQQWNEYEFSGDERLRPKAETYNTAMRAWVGLDQPKEVEKILNKLVELSEKEETIRPDSESYAILIRAWLSQAKRGSDWALMNAAKWLGHLRKQEQAREDISSSVELYASFLAAARTCTPHRPADVLRAAVVVFDELRTSYHMMDCLHFSRLLQVGLLALSRPENQKERLAFIAQLVGECKDAGLVSEPLLRALADGPIFSDGWTAEESERVIDELFPEWPLPLSWTQSLRQKGMLPKRGDLVRRNFSLSFHGSDPYRNRDSAYPTKKMF